LEFVGAQRGFEGVVVGLVDGAVAVDVSWGLSLEVEIVDVDGAVAVGVEVGFYGFGEQGVEAKEVGVVDGVVAVEVVEVVALGGRGGASSAPNRNALN
jgi:hypothetical protein